MSKILTQKKVYDHGRNVLLTLFSSEGDSPPPIFASNFIDTNNDKFVDTSGNEFLDAT